MPRITIPKLYKPYTHPEHHYLWTTNEGDQIAVCNMTNLHLARSIEFMNDVVLMGYEALSMLRGDMALYYAESETQNSEMTLAILTDEAHRRIAAVREAHSEGMFDPASPNYYKKLRYPGEDEVAYNLRQLGASLQMIRDIATSSKIEAQMAHQDDVYPQTDPDEFIKWINDEI